MRQMTINEKERCIIMMNSKYWSSQIVVKESLRSAENQLRNNEQERAVLEDMSNGIGISREDSIQFFGIKPSR